jgi:hypothetical protein
MAAAIAALGGILIAALSLWLNYKGRGAPQRQIFYQKQVDAYVAVMNALNTLHNACQEFIAVNGFRLNRESRLKMRLAMSNGEISAAYRDFHLQHQTWALFLPSSMHERISSFTKVLAAISAPDEIANQYPTELVNSHDPGMELGKAYSNVVSAARHGLGVEPLSKEILKLIGESPSKQIENR